MANSPIAKNRLGGNYSEKFTKETDYTKNSKLSADFCQKNQPPHCSAIGGSQDVRFSTFESPLVDFLFQNFFSQTEQF